MDFQNAPAKVDYPDCLETVYWLDRNEVRIGYTLYRHVSIVVWSPTPDF